MEENTEAGFSVEHDDRPAAQVEAETEAVARADGAVPIVMGNGKAVHVPMQVGWKKSAQDFINHGDFDSWAESVLSDDDLGLWDEWIDSDPTMGEILDFMEALGKATGLAARGNRASRRSSQRTPRR